MDTTSSTGRWKMALWLLVVSIFVLTPGCRRDASSSELELRPTSVGLSPTAISTIAAHATPRFTDARQLAAYYAQRAAAGDWHALEGVLADEYQSVEFGLSSKTLEPMFGPGNTLGLTPSEWDVEEDHDYVIARHSQVAVAMRRDNQGFLRLDPGSCAFYRASLWQQHPRMTRLGGAAYQSTIISAQRAEDIARQFSDSPRCVVISETGIDVTVRWQFVRVEAAVVLLDNVYWEAGSDHGPVNVTWTTAVRESDKLSFPIPVDESPSQLLGYDVTFHLEGATADLGTTLNIDGFTIVPVGGPELKFSIHYKLPTSSYPQPGP